MLVFLLAGLLAVSSAQATAPAWSPDGTVAYVRDGQVWRGLQPVGPGSSPVWSPDGTRLAWVDDGRLLVDGVQLADGLTAAPAWSPDGQRLAFERRAGADAALLTVPVGGGTPTRLGFGASTVSPAWLGATIAYVDDHRLYLWPGHRLVSPLTVTSAPSRHGASLAFSGPKGIAVVMKGRQRLLGKGSGPVFSSDGARLAFTIGTAVWQMNADGTCRARVGNGGEPAWKPVAVGRIRC